MRLMWVVRVRTSKASKFASVLLTNTKATPFAWSRLCIAPNHVARYDDGHYLPRSAIHI
jgi:hypothetical protein